MPPPSVPIFGAQVGNRGQTCEMCRFLAFFAAKSRCFPYAKPEMQHEGFRFSYGRLFDKIVSNIERCLRRCLQAFYYARPREA